MPDQTLGAFRATYQEIAKKLDAAKGPDEAVKKEIIGLFKTVDQAITDFSALKEEIRVLVDRYKQLAQTGEAEPAAAPVGSRSVFTQISRRSGSQATLLGATP